MAHSSPETPASEINPLTGLADEQSPAPIETIIPHPVSPMEIELSQPTEPPQIDVIKNPEVPPVSIDTSVSQPEIQNVVEAQSIVNAFNVEVSTVEPHVYADSTAEHMFVYGGSPEKQAGMILKYLVENPDKTVYGTDDKGLYRIPWYLVDGKAVPGTPVQTAGIFGLFKSFMDAPKPDEFAKIIK